MKTMVGPQVLALCVGAYVAGSAVTWAVLRRAPNARARRSNPEALGGGRSRPAGNALALPLHIALAAMALTAAVSVGLGWALFDTEDEGPEPGKDRTISDCPPGMSFRQVEIPLSGPDPFRPGAPTSDSDGISGQLVKRYLVCVAL